MTATQCILASIAAASLTLAITRTRAQPAGGTGPSGNSVRSITLPSIAFEIPEGPGREPFIARCVACHTSRYVFNQPAFSKDTWTAEVQKMRKTFGAPVGDEQVDDIVAYLMKVRGK